MNKIVILIIVAAVAIFQAIQEQKLTIPDGLIQTLNKETSNKTESADLQTVFDNRQNDVQIRGVGTVIKLLADDLDGSRHQKFILRTGNGNTVLIAHNIDLAPRVGGIRKGDKVEFYGEYEWNSRGGVIHWTHKDPRHYHVDGWLKHGGKTYQ